MSRWSCAVIGLGVVAIGGAIGIGVVLEAWSAGAIKSTLVAPADEEWQSHLAAVDRAARANEIGEAVRAWRDAYGVALGSRQWEPMLAVGQAAVRIGRAAGTRKGHDEKARQCYLIALFRARQQRSVDGVLLVAEAFADLGDVEVAARALHIADSLARRASDDIDPAAAPLSRPEHAAVRSPRRRELGAAP